MYICAKSIVTQDYKWPRNKKKKYQLQPLASIDQPQHSMSTCVQNLWTAGHIRRRAFRQIQSATLYPSLKVSDRKDAIN